MFESMGFLDATCSDEMDASVSAYLAEAIPRGEYRGWLVTTAADEAIAGAGLAVVRLPGSPRNVCGLSAYLMSLYVEPEYRRQGIARHLIQTMIGWSRAQGITQIALHASDQGRPLYESLCFRTTNEMRLFL